MRYGIPGGIVLWFIMGAPGCKPGEKVESGSETIQMPRDTLGEPMEASSPEERWIAFAVDVAQTVGKHLRAEVVRAIRDRGLEGAIRYCNEKAIPITEELAEEHGVEVRRWSHRARNPHNRAEGELKTILEQFQRNLQAGKPLHPVVRQTARDVRVYIPIRIPDAFCLNCHGVVGRNISEEFYETVIQQLYPEDQAVNFQVGDLRGMWEVRIPREKAEELTAS